MGRQRRGRTELRYDACIIGAGAEGLSCAATLAARGRRVIVVERGAAPGGRCVTRSFAPGFSASPFADELPAIPSTVFRDLDLGRHGAILTSAAEPGEFAGRIRAAVMARAMADASTVPARAWLRRIPPPLWPGEDLAARALADCGATGTLAVCDPDLGGSALALLAGPPGGMPRGGLGALGAALRAAAEAAGAEISCGLEVTDIRRSRGRVVGVALADGSEIAARAVVSTLDLKRTFLALFAWNALPKPLIERIGAFRAAPGIARLLVALESLPAITDDADLRRPLLFGGSPTEAYRAWSGGIIPASPPAVLRVVSAVDPFLAPDGAAVVTVTLGGIPHTPFDGPWTNDKRSRLRDSALAMVEAAFPGSAAKVKAAELIVPPDIENQLGLTEGDLQGGALTASQMLGYRPFSELGPDSTGSRTPVAGLYLAGPSSVLGPLATCASGVVAATAVAADLGAGRLG